MADIPEEFKDDLEIRERELWENEICGTCLYFDDEGAHCFLRGEDKAETDDSCVHWRGYYL